MRLRRRRTLSWCWPGDGPERPALQRRAQRSGGRVHFAGFVPHVRVPAVPAHVDLLVLPSL